MPAPPRGPLERSDGSSASTERGVPAPSGGSSPAPVGAGGNVRAVTAAVALAAVEDLQGTSADLGWPEATALADALVDTLAHLLVDVGAGRAAPSPRPAVVGAIGGPPGPLDHASCRGASAALRRAGAALTAAGPPWAAEAADVALDLADLLQTCADRARTGRLRETQKGVVLRALRAQQRRLHALT